MEKIEFTILMPCLNEEKTIASCILEAQQFVEKYGLSAEVLIADNNSTDRSVVLAEALGARVVSVPQKGYGNALIGGIRAARGTYIIMGDCDGSYDFSALEGFVEKLREGCGLVMGNRFAGGIEKGAMPFAHRYFGVPFLSLVGRVCYNVSVTDFHCGLRGFHRQKALELNLSCPGMEFATEMIGGFAKSGAGIAQIPIKLRRDGRCGRSHLRTLPDGWRHLRYMLFQR
ncbi:MAG: glycosyltransferase family 2 protein [Lachnospiraceae bacterium]|nr:glycosyltransferase family 2 protein [Lachnospiraceae bacterium]